MSVHTPFTSVLVANRGEIALRIMRAVRSAGLSCVAVYTQADAGAAHVRFADKAVCIGEGPVADSYLSVERILQAAHDTGAQAVHPGYGFLSENAGLARACDQAGLVFIGPSPDAIALMGDKAQAKALMIKAGVPCILGYQGADQSDTRLMDEATTIGFPVMIKAAAGGGGRGMRLVAGPAGFVDALHLARSEAMAGFGSDRMILEKAVTGARHVEVQVIADRTGNVLHLGERDCSAQRRHQKVIEEAPCPVVTSELRAKMGAAAVAAARAVGYEGAGTVEFLLDERGNFYFLEMNTRLQVEHPVTELVTGHDLVALQLSVAQGLPLGFGQQEVALTGHAIEARLYAEDPEQDFRPDSGEIALWKPPVGTGIRVDDGIATGQVVSPFYDPMLAKIIAYGDSREQARQRLIAALQDSVLFGVKSNRDFLRMVLQSPDFVTGQATTAMIDDLPMCQTGLKGADIALAAGLIYRELQARRAIEAGVTAELLGWGSPGVLNARLRLSEGADVQAVNLHETGDGDLFVVVAGETYVISGQGAETRINGIRTDLRAQLYDGTHIHVATGTRQFSLTHDRAVWQAAQTANGGELRAPMHGVLAQICVAPGDEVQVGTRLAVLEAMKMQQDLLSEVAGTIKVVSVAAGTQVKAGDVLVEITVGDAE